MHILSVGESWAWSERKEINEKTLNKTPGKSMRRRCGNHKCHSVYRDACMQSNHEWWRMNKAWPSGVGIASDFRK